MRFNLYNILLLLSLLLSNSLNHYSYAATQGVAGATSTGTLDFGISISANVRITDIDDAVFGSWSGSGNMSNNDNICIYSTSDTGGYSITATGDGPGDSFQVTDGSNYIDYQVRWNDVAGTNSGGVNLTSGQVLTGQTGGDTVSEDCNSGANLNARVRVRFLSGDLASAVGSPTPYSGTLTFTIASE